MEDKQKQSKISVLTRYYRQCIMKKRLTDDLFDSIILNLEIYRIRALLKNGADINARNSKGYSPLTLACMYRRDRIICLLIVSGANVDCCDEKKCTLLHYVSQNDWPPQMVDIVVNRGNAQVHEYSEIINARDVRGETPMHYASKSGKQAAVVHLIQVGANYNLKNIVDFTPLLCAAQSSRKAIFDDLLFLFHTRIDGDEELLLYYAVQNNWTDIVQYLLKQVPYLNEKYVIDETDMDTPCRKHLKLVKCLIGEGTDINTRNEKIIRAALFRASSVGHLEVVEWLVKRAPDLNTRDCYGFTALHHASQGGNLEIVKFLVEEGADINTREECGEAVLLTASRNGNLEVVKYLMEKGADISSRDGLGRTVLHAVSTTGYLEGVKYLVEKGADISAKDQFGRTVLHEVSKNGNLELVKYLLEKEADINSEDETGRTALHELSRIRHLEGVKYIVEKGAYINKRDRIGRTALYEVLRIQHLEGVKYLVENGAGISGKDVFDRTVLHEVSEAGYLEGVKYLIEKGADINVRSIEAPETPLLCAAYFNHKNVVDMLMNLGANTHDSNDYTMLHLASLCGWIDVVQSLVTRGCDLNARCVACGFTALYYACKYERFDVVQLLLQAGAKKDIADLKRKSPLNYLTSQQVAQFNFIKLFIENGAYLKPIDYDGLLKSSSLEVLQHVKLSCQTIINKFNNHSLPELYKLSASESLPRLEKIKIVSGSEVAQAIEQTVGFEIQTKGHCNILKVCPMVLRVLCVESILEYKKQTSKLKKRVKRQVALYSVNNRQQSVKLRRVN